jgi:predicted deacylase
MRMVAMQQPIPEEEHTVVARMALGDRRALAELYTRYERPLLTYLRPLSWLPGQEQVECETEGCPTSSGRRRRPICRGSGRTRCFSRFAPQVYSLLQRCHVANVARKHRRTPTGSTTAMTEPLTSSPLDRRGFLSAAIGASAAFSAVVMPASVDASAATPVPGRGGTVYTGDTIEGKQVITALDVKDLEPGQKHLFYFRGVQTPAGQHSYVSVMVAKGAQPGPRVALISGVHGDEISSIRTVQRVMEQLDPAEMSGTVLAVFDVSRPALITMQRRWPNTGRGFGLIDINREWPGNANGGTAASRHAALVFSQLLAPNADYAIDFHTAATGMDMTDLLVAPLDQPEVRAMAELFPVRQIFDFAGYPGLLAIALAEVGIPTFTPEVGAPRIVDQEMIAAFVEGTMNVLKHHGIVSGPIGRTGTDTAVFVGDGQHAVAASEGGFVEVLVQLDEEVSPGQMVATQRNTFGEVVADYATDTGGRIAAFRTDATAEPGDPLVFVLFDSTAPQEQDETEVMPE